MRYLKLWAFAAVILSGSSPLNAGLAGRQDPALEARYENALRVAQAGDYERAYEMSERIVSQDMLFYKGAILRIALATILKKSGPEDPKNLLRVFKGHAPIGSNPEGDVRDLINRLNNASASAANTDANDAPVTSKDSTPPKITITSPSLSRGVGVKPASGNVFKQSGGSLNVAGQATDESGVREVKVNGMTARLNERGAFSAEVPLQIGDNPITVTAMDVHGNRATESFTVRREGALSPVSGRYFALVIGNNRYPNLPANRQLQTAINDAREVAKLLSADYGFETKTLVNAKRAEIITALNQYRRSLGPDDKLLIYYAGHGHFDKDTDKAYWQPVDAEENNNANWIIADDVTTNVRAIPARHILIVSDSCYSGTLTRSSSGRLSVPAERERYLEKMRGGIARILMASGGNEPVADGGGGGHSVFARAFLDGLRGMDEQVFTAEELFHQHIKERVAGKADQTPGYYTLHSSGHEAGDFVFVRKQWQKQPSGQKTEEKGAPNGATRPTERNDYKKSGSILLLITETVDGSLAVDDAVSRAIAGKLAGNSLSVTTSSELAEADSERVRLAIKRLQAGGQRGGSAIPFAVAVTGTISVSHLAPFQGLNVAVADGSLKAIDTNSGKTLAVEDISGVRGFGNTRDQAAGNALKKAGENIAESLAKKILANFR